MKATNATVANAAAMSSNITAIANNNSDFPDQASKENNKFVEAINIPDISKWILAFGMLLGRLELFAVLVLFFPSFWRN